MTASTVLDKKVSKSARKSIVVTYGGGQTFEVSGKLLDLLDASTDELRQAHRARSGEAPINHLASHHLAHDVKENGSLLFELAVYARFEKGFHPSRLRAVQCLLTPDQHSTLRKMTIAGKSRIAGAKGYSA